MIAERRKSTGFTVIELMVTVAVMLVLIVIAQPSFDGLRQRTALRGAAEHVLSFWNQARLEAAKRNQMVKVGVVVDASGNYCLGAATTSSPGDDVPCDCTVPNPASNKCDIAQFPGDQSEWRGVTLSGMTLGGSTFSSDMEPAVIEPKRTNLIVPGDAGTVSLSSPAGRVNYKVNMWVDRFGRAMLCESENAQDHLSDYGNRQCPDAAP